MGAKSTRSHLPIGRPAHRTVDPNEQRRLGVDDLDNRVPADAPRERQKPALIAASDWATDLSRSCSSGLRCVDAVKVDYFLRNLERNVRLHVCVEPGVVLLLRLPHLGNHKAFGIFIRDMDQEARLLLELLD